MRGKLYRLETFYLFDHTGIQHHLEKMAAKGWLIDKLGSFWRYHRIEPRRLRFAVTYFPEASVYDAEPREGQWDYQELCRDAGWTHAVTNGQIQIFYTEAEDPLPLETDPQLQVENIHRTMWRSQVPSFLVMMALGLMQLGLQWRTYSWNPVEWLCSTSGAMACFCWLTIIALQAVSLADYLRWHHRARAEALEGRFTPTFSRVRLQNSVILLVLAALVLWGASIWGTHLGTFSVIFALVMLVLVGGATTAVTKFLKWQKASSSANRWGTALAAGLTALFVFGWGTTAAIRGVGNGWLEESRVVETYTAYGMTREVYGDPIPLRIEDLLEVDYDRWSTEAETDASPVMASHQYRQDARMGDRDVPELAYTVVEVKWDSLYAAAENALLQRAERHNSPDFPEFWETYIPIDPSPWGALRAYQIREGGEMKNSYLLCWEDHLVTITFYDWEGSVTQAQMAKTGEILG